MLQGTRMMGLRRQRGEGFVACGVVTTFRSFRTACSAHCPLRSQSSLNPFCIPTDQPLSPGRTTASDCCCEEIDSQTAAVAPLATNACQETLFLVVRMPLPSLVVCCRWMG